MANSYRVALIGPPRPVAQLPSLALAQLAAVAREQGHEALLRDAAASGASLQSTVEEIVAFRPDLLGLTATTADLRSAGALAAAVRRALPECLCALGGPHASAVPRSTLEAEPAFDCAIVGEGEETLLELLARLPWRDFSGVRGLAWRDGPDIRVEEPRPRIGDLNVLPLPWWEGYPGYPEAYYRAAAGRRKPASYVVTSRGCARRCTFCDRGVFGQAIATFSAEYLLRAVDDMVRRFGIRDLSFEDDLFTAYEPRLRRVCEGLIERRHDLTWRCVARPETVSKETFRLMRRAGCRHVTVGVDSADAGVLEVVRRKTLPEQIAHTVRSAHRARLPVTGCFFLGLPGETEETIERSIRFALELPFDDIEVRFVAPLPGTEISDRLEEWGHEATGVEAEDAACPPFIPHGLTSERLRRRRAEFNRRFYFRARQLPGLIGRFVCAPKVTVRSLWAGK